MDTPVESLRAQILIGDYDITEFVLSGNVSKSFANPLGQWQLQLRPVISGKRSVDLKNININDYCEIRVGREGKNDTIPILTRGLVSAVEITESVSNDSIGVPQKSISIIGFDLTKAFFAKSFINPVNEQFSPNTLKRNELIRKDLGKTLPNVPTAATIQGLGEWFTYVVQNVFGDELLGLSVVSNLNFVVDKNLPNISSGKDLLGINVTNSMPTFRGNIWAYLTGYAPKPIIEIFVEDRDDFSAVRMRWTPFRISASQSARKGQFPVRDSDKKQWFDPDYVSTFGLKSPEQVIVSANEIISKKVRRSDNDVFTYFYTLWLSYSTSGGPTGGAESFLTSAPADSATADDIEKINAAWRNFDIEETIKNGTVAQKQAARKKQWQDIPQKKNPYYYMEGVDKHGLKPFVFKAPFMLFQGAQEIENARVETTTAGSPATTVATSTSHLLSQFRQRLEPDPLIPGAMYKIVSIRSEPIYPDGSVGSGAVTDFVQLGAANLDIGTTFVYKEGAIVKKNLVAPPGTAGAGNSYVVWVFAGTEGKDYSWAPQVPPGHPDGIEIGSGSCQKIADAAPVAPSAPVPVSGGAEPLYMNNDDGTNIVLPPSGSRTRDQAIQWAARYRNTTQGNSYAWWCERFVEHAYGTKHQYAEAMSAGDNARNVGIVTSGIFTTVWDNEPTIGAIIFFKRAAVNKGHGHVAIYVGNGHMIGAEDQVKVTNFISNPGWRSIYHGWDTPEYLYGQMDHAGQRLPGQQIMGTVQASAIPASTKASFALIEKNDPSIFPTLAFTSGTGPAPVMGPISAEQAAAAETARKNAVTAAATAVVSTKVRALESSLITAKKELTDDINTWLVETMSNSDEHYNGQMSMRGNPHIRIGQELYINYNETADEKEKMERYYVEQVVHSFSFFPSPQFITNIGVTRGEHIPEKDASEVLTNVSRSTFTNSRRRVSTVGDQSDAFTYTPGGGSGHRDSDDR